LHVAQSVQRDADRSLGCRSHLLGGVAAFQVDGCADSAFGSIERSVR